MLALTSRESPLPAPAMPLPAPRQRVDAIDLARGIAICLMILSHGVNGLLTFEQFSPFGLVPVHAATKVASSLFIVVFGVALAVVFVPRVGSAAWPRYRWKLLGRGLQVLFWYLLLALVEDGRWNAAAVADVLAWRSAPSYVEILGFYAIALLWVPFFLPLWARLPAWLRIASPLLWAWAAWLLAGSGLLAGWDRLQAVLVEHEDYYTWGQLSRGPLVLLGLLLGGWVQARRGDPAALRRVGAAVAVAGLLLLAGFALQAGDALGQRLDALARNVGKHPPSLEFMAFSLGGALLLLGTAMLGGNRLARLLRPVTVIGTNALQAFVFHIIVIFVLYRGALGWLHAVSYSHALLATLALMAASAAWVWAIDRCKRQGRATAGARRLSAMNLPQ